MKIKSASAVCKKAISFVLLGGKKVAVKRGSVIVELELLISLIVINAAVKSLLEKL